LFRAPYAEAGNWPVAPGHLAARARLGAEPGDRVHLQHHLLPAYVRTPQVEKQSFANGGSYPLDGGWTAR
jgi:hypothetical protein